MSWGTRVTRELRGRRPAARELGVLLADEGSADRFASQPVEGLGGDVGGVRGRRRGGGSARRGGRGRARRGFGRPCGRGRRRCRCSRRRRRRWPPRSGTTIGRWVGETSTGPPQAWVMRRPARPGKYSRRRAAATRDHVGVELGPAAQPRAHRDPAAAPAEGDAAVRGGAEVVDQGAAVGDALAPGPADLLEQLGDRLGEDDVGGGDGERVAQRRPGRLRRAPDRDHRRAGADRAAIGLRDHRAPDSQIGL